jgi:hypothetical protein
MTRIDDLRHMFNNGKPLRSPFIKKDPKKKPNDEMIDRERRERDRERMREIQRDRIRRQMYDDYR